MKASRFMLWNVFLLFFGVPLYLNAATTSFNTNTWDDAGGLTASINNSNDKVTISGARMSQGTWATSGLNYQAGATTALRLPSPGTLAVDVIGTGAGGA